MNVRFGIIFLVVAMVFAIGIVRSEEAEAGGLEEMHGESKRSPDPLDMKKLAAEIRKRLGRSADPSMKKLMEMIKARKGRKAERSADPDPDPGMLDMLKKIPVIGGFMG
uniref:VenA2 n=1 Tax=Hyposoter didymator TaxID=260305 RepID=M4TPZ6_HYPDD|nr:VenA2 [Hyposoter didymator]